MQFVFDTNALVSALLFENSIPAQAFFTARRIGEILISDALVTEISEVLHRKKFDRYLTQDDREEFLISLVQFGRLVNVTEQISVCRDPKDNHILELAVSGKSDAIVTGDDDLLTLHPFEGIAILDPRTFLEKYNSG